jgi:hypothetical protein
MRVACLMERQSRQKGGRFGHSEWTHAEETDLRERCGFPRI